jgi:hypothetical protein
MTHLLLFDQAHVYATHEFWLRNLHRLEKISDELEFPVSDPICASQES